MPKMNDNALYFEEIELHSLAQEYGTPLYVYSKASIVHAYRQFEQAFKREHLVCYAVKANSNIAVLRELVKLGSGFDVVSGGELARALAAGADPQKIVFSGVGKTIEEMRYALTENIHCFNIESAAEITQLNAIAAELGKPAPVSLRVNPNVDAKSHPYISTGLKENKFGIAIEEAEALYHHAHGLPYLNVIGIDCHIGSQLTSLSPYADALDKLLQLVDRLMSQGIPLQHFDIGGGTGICYQDEKAILPQEWGALIEEKIGSRQLSIITEPGRAIVANAGVLLTKVLLTKQNDQKYFAVVDAAMNDLIRPALYQAWMRVVNTKRSDAPLQTYDIVGPVCETADFLAKARSLALEKDDILAITQAGAYSFVMSSNYNSRPRACEIMIDREQAHVIRPRETIASLYAQECFLPDDDSDANCKA